MGFVQILLKNLFLDEFDKMTDADRTTLHEVMEQGQVTITKSGAHETLNARCSTLAAANPLKGCYDPELSLMKNIAIQDSLLSRFDLIFPMIDLIDVNKDRVIANDVAYAHAYR
jgi:DNA replication licensing factor MCM3